MAYSGFHKEGGNSMGSEGRKSLPSGVQGQNPGRGLGTKMFLFRMDSSDRFAIWGSNRAYLSNSFCDMNQ